MVVQWTTDCVEVSLPKFLFIESFDLPFAPLLFGFQILVLEIEADCWTRWSARLLWDVSLGLDGVLHGRLQWKTRSFGPDGGSAATGDQRLVVLEFLSLNRPKNLLGILEVVVLGHLEELLVRADPFLIHASAVTLARKMIPPLLIGDLVDVVPSLASAHAVGHGVRVVYNWC